MRKQTEIAQTYLWEGITRTGVRVKGELHAISSDNVYAELKKQRIDPTKIKRKSNLGHFCKPKIKRFDIELLSRHLATLIAAGVPLIPALTTIRNASTKIHMKALVTAIKNDLASGMTLNDAFKKHPNHFNELFCNLVKAGEQSGTLEITLKRIADYLERREALKKKILKAMYYPLTVLFISLLVSGVLLVFIVPKFDQLFNSFGSKLPFFTRSVISLSRCLQTYGHLFFLAGLVFGWVFRYLKNNSKRIKSWIDHLLLKLPIMGKIIHKSIIARITRTLATLLAAGIPILDALQSIITIANNNKYAVALEQVQKEIQTGQQIHTTMNATQLFPPMMIQLIAVGEESGTIDKMLDKIASFYEEDLESLVNSITALMEPIIIVMLSILVGSFVLAMYLPIFRLGSIM